LASSADAPKSDNNPWTSARISSTETVIEPVAKAVVQSGNRYETWIMLVDSDNSGGASRAELIASGDGDQWFSDMEFDAADRNDDGDLDAKELGALVNSIERRNH
jgi:hypothetical protein